MRGMTTRLNLRYFQHVHLQPRQHSPQLALLAHNHGQLLYGYEVHYKVAIMMLSTTEA
jgi:hypothetical protein